MFDYKNWILQQKIKCYDATALRFYKDLLNSQFFSSDELFQINWVKRKKLLLHAFDSVPYYKKKYRAEGINRTDITNITPDNFISLPLLYRSDIKENYEDLVSTTVQPKYMKMVATGGSTGEPIRVYHDKRFYGEVLAWRMLSWWGISPGANQAVIFRSIRKSNIQKFLNFLVWFPTQRIFLDASSIDDVEVMSFLTRFNKFRPSLLKGYVGAISHIATKILQTDIRVFSPKAIWVTAAPLSKVQRNLINKAFAAPVYDQYACSEMHWIAAECSNQNRLHIFTESRHVEFLDLDKLHYFDTSLKRIVITDLENYAFPLIRYENGDLGKPVYDKCPCGVNLPMMESVSGRVSENVQFPDGTFISGEYLTTIFDDNPEAVMAFQVHQHVDYSLEINVVPNTKNPNYSQGIEQVRELLLEKVRHNVPVRVNYVKNIKNDRGKTRYVISDLQSLL